MLGQLIEFLELTELAPFRGFRDDDFEFFKTLALEQRPVVKNRLAGTDQEVVSLLTEAERDAIGELHVGQLGEGADHAWLHTHEGQDIVNLTLELYAEELQVNIVGWRRDQAASMEMWLLSERGQQALRTLPEHDLVIYKRSAFNISRRETGARPWWQKARSVKLTQRAAHEADRAWLSGILKQLNDRSWEKPGLHIRRSWSRATVVKARETIAHHVAEELQRLLPMVTQINVAADAA